MAARIRNKSWIEDQELMEAMKKCVSQGLKREKILDYLERDFSQYAWSFRTLDASEHLESTTQTNVSLWKK